MTAALAVLVRARAILAEPSSWTKGYYAKASRRARTAISIRSPQATCFCLSGAIQKAAFELDGDFYEAAQAFRQNSGIPESIIEFNDYLSTQHTDVLRVLDRSIAALSGDAGGEEMGT